MHYVYRHIRKDTDEVFYVGKGSTVPNKYTQLSRYYRAYNLQGRSDWWKRIVDKAGYEVEIIFESDCEDIIFEKEKEFIELYGRRDLGKGTLVNLTNGGEGESGRVFTEEHRRRLSESKKGVPRNLSNETLERLSKRVRGEKNYFYGKRLAGEANGFYGKKHTEEFLDKHLRGKANPMYGMTGDKNPFYGRTHSDEFKRFKQVHHSNPVEVITPTGEVLNFICVADCAEHFNCTSKNILHRNRQDSKGKFAKSGMFKGYKLKILKDE